MRRPAAGGRPVRVTDTATLGGETAETGGRRRRDVRRLLTIADVFGLMVVTLALGVWTAQLGLAPSTRTAVMRVWVIVGAVSVILNRSAMTGGPFEQRSPVNYTPVWSLLIATAALLAIDAGRWWPALAVIHAGWLAVTAAFTVVVHRLSPPLRLGVLTAGPGTPAPVSGRPDIEYVPVSTHQPESLLDIDGLLTHSAPLMPDQQRLVEHAHLMKLRVYPRVLLEEDLSGKVSLDLLEHDWLNRTSFASRYSVVKRAVDVTATVLAAPVLLPVMGVVALIVYFNSGRPVIFTQERVGLDGSTFVIYKFRTMTRDSERSGPAFAQRGDQRVTPVGAFLRKFRLDELPQFYNVLRGDMSIIGPRPEQWAFAADFEESIPLYGTRHWVRPGITGWAQVNQGYAADAGQTAEKLQYDFYYVKHLSLRLDLRIVVKTLHTILTGFGAR